MGIKIVLLARNCDSSSIVFNYLQKHIEFDAVLIEKPLSKSRHLSKRIKRLGFWYAMGQAAFMLLVYPILKIISKKRKQEIIEKYNLDLRCIPKNIYQEVISLNNETSRKFLKELDPDLIIINGTGIISKKTLECVSASFINIHVGITPLFRGVHGGYWAMATDRKDMFGVTIHYVDPGVDTGGIIEQVFITPSPKDNFYTYPYIEYAEVLPALKKVVDSFNTGMKPDTKLPVTTESALRFHPTLFQYLKNLRRTF